jgi:hypothetical protein
MYGSAARYVEVARRQDINKLIDIDEDWQPPEDWSESLFDELRKFLVGHYSPSMSTVQALLIAQNHRASLDRRSTIVWLICGLVSSSRFHDMNSTVFASLLIICLFDFTCHQDIRMVRF